MKKKCLKYNLAETRSISEAKMYDQLRKNKASTYKNILLNIVLNSDA